MILSFKHINNNCHVLERSFHQIIAAATIDFCAERRAFCRRASACLMVLAAVLTCAMPTTASAADRATAEDAKAMLSRAAARYDEVGKDQALAEFTAAKPPFADRDLYVFCLNQSDGHWTAHGANKALVGRDLILVKDADGKSIGEAILTAVHEQPTASISYKWPDPVTHKVAPKLTFLQKVGDQVCAVGVYEFKDPS